MVERAVLNGAVEAQAAQDITGAEVDSHQIIAIVDISCIAQHRHYAGIVQRHAALDKGIGGITDIDGRESAIAIGDQHPASRASHGLGCTRCIDLGDESRVHAVEDIENCHARHAVDGTAINCVPGVFAMRGRRCGLAGQRVDIMNHWYPLVAPLHSPHYQRQIKFTCGC